jgi:hypothetical protein
MTDNIKDKRITFVVRFLLQIRKHLLFDTKFTPCAKLK